MFFCLRLYTEAECAQTEHEHVRAKRHWVRSAKAKAMVAPCIAKHQKRERHMWEIQQALNKQMKQKASKNRKKNPWFNTPLSESLPHADPGVHHQMSRTVKKQNRINLLKWVHSNKDDPALEVCLCSCSCVAVCSETCLGLYPEVENTPLASPPWSIRRFQQN